MGQAKRRRDEIDKLKSREVDWLATLDVTHRAIATTAINAFENIVIKNDLTGGCYNLAFFLREYLKRERDIAVEMVVGWVTDSSWSGAISHAWIEYGGKKTDISIWNTEHPEAQLPGAVLLHDFVYRRGQTTYTYHHVLPESARQFLHIAASDTEFGALYRHKEAEHSNIKQLASRSSGAVEYFSNAPTEMRYESLATMLA